MLWLYIHHVSNLHDDAILTLLWLTSLLSLLNLGNHTLECFSNVLVESGTGLCEAASQLFGQLATIFGLDLTLFGSQIRLVADDDQRDGVSTLEEYVSW